MEKEEIKVDTPVIYWAIVKENGERENPYRTSIAMGAWDIDGATLCKIHGRIGGIDIKHLDPITTGSLMAAKLSGLKDVTDEEIISETKKCFRNINANAEVTIGNN